MILVQVVAYCGIVPRSDGLNSVYNCEVEYVIQKAFFNKQSKWKPENIASWEQADIAAMVEFGFETTGDDVVAAFPGTLKGKTSKILMTENAEPPADRGSTHNRSQLGEYWFRDSHHFGQGSSGHDCLARSRH